MSQPHTRGSPKTSEPQRRASHQAAAIQGTAHDGETAEYGYDRAIFDLLRDPVSLGMRGSNNNRGHQR